MDDDLIVDPTATLLTTYAELNSTSITTLSELPSPLEFLRYVALNRPFVIRGGAADWKAVQTWDVEALKRRMEGMRVNVAVTPNGKADAPTRCENGETLFVKPWEEEQDFGEFLDFVIRQEKGSKGVDAGGEVRYAQTQNDNLRNEYSTLFADVQKDIPWARIALSQSPEAINLWIGNSLSTTALHKDNYENIYVQIIGQKHFVLLPPIAYACVAERKLRPGSYWRGEDGNVAIKEEHGEKVPFATWDPDVEEGEEVSRYSKLATPVRVTLAKGDMLYLPALWYHKVSQSCEEGICCAVNYWHDMEFGGSFYPLCGLARNVVLASTS